MRRSIPARAILVGALLAAGCNKEEAAPKPAADDKAGTSSTGDKGGPQAGKSEGGRKLPGGRQTSQALGARLGLEQLTVEEVKPLLPKLEGGTSLGEPTSTARGLRVTAMECVTGEMADIKTKLEARLKEIGFTTVRSSERKTMKILTVSAEKSPYRMSASVRSGPYPDCPADQKKSKLLMSFFKRPPRPPGGATPGTKPAPAPATDSASKPPASEPAK
jgi:hypothetical protein